MTIASYTITFDATDAGKLAVFWSAALNRPVAAGAAEDYAALEQSGSAPGISFYKVPEPKTAKNRVHLDLSVGSLDDEVTRLLTLGARQVARLESDGTGWVTLTDPEGNEFDLIQA